MAPRAVATVPSGGLLSEQESADDQEGRNDMGGGNDSD